jgi:hypothetical protein
MPERWADSSERAQAESESETLMDGPLVNSLQVLPKILEALWIQLRDVVESLSRQERPRFGKGGVQVLESVP